MVTLTLYSTTAHKPLKQTYAIYTHRHVLNKKSHSELVEESSIYCMPLMKILQAAFRMTIFYPPPSCINILLNYDLFFTAPSFPFFITKSIILPATSILVACWKPFQPGTEFTSKNLNF